MPVQKERRADLRARYPLYVEIGLIVALGLLITAFRVNWVVESDVTFEPPPQEHFTVEDAPQTLHEETPPPPPRPLVPVVVPDDRLPEIEEVDLGDYLNIEALLPKTPPPLPDEEADEAEEAVPFWIVEEEPALIGGYAALLKKLEYPEIARRAGVEGRVTVQFIVDERGVVQEAVVLQGPGAGLDEEALRVIREARFTPGRQRGRPVRVKMSLSVAFKLR